MPHIKALKRTPQYKNEQARNHERLARTLHRVYRQEGYLKPQRWREVPELVKESWRRIARKVEILEGIR